MRGEDDYSDQSKYLIEGSPPHARGRPERDHRPLGVVRITPACAGKTVRTASLSLDLSDHPRMRGEDALRRHNDMSNQGSPPHARGRRRGPTSGAARWGITPACAGKTRRPRSERGHLPDHPRMRGEDVWLVGWWFFFGGSPPHARGRRVARPPHPRPARITPACAGKTLVGSGAWGITWDHPRMRGEDDPMDNSSAQQTGSPPHARGRRD